MTAKQTALSASLVALLAAPALAEEPPEQPPGEVRPMPLIPKREPTGTFQIGAGYSSDHGFSARARVEQASLFGTGKLLAFESTISAREQDMRLIYEDPGLLGTQLRLRGDLYANQTRFIGFTREDRFNLYSAEERIA